MTMRLLKVLGFLVGYAATPAGAEVVQMSAELSGANEVPAVQTPAAGSAKVTLDTETRELRWEIVFDGLSAPVSAMHFHGPSTTAQNAKVLVPIAEAGATSPVSGAATLTPEQMADLLAGRWYINVHTQNHPPGEIRGQVVKK